MDETKTTITLATISLVALVISIYAGINSYQLKASLLDSDNFNEKVEASIEAYVKKQQEKTAKPPEPSGPVDVSIDDDAVMGDPNAKVTIIEFSEYQCPYCGRHANGPLQEIKKNYVDTGKAKFVFRDFPLAFHDNAKPAAIAAECVREQGGDDSYFEYHDVLFQNQKALDADSLKQYASDMGYDIGTCLDTEKYGDEVDKDMEDGKAAGVRGTPATFINGRMVSGAQPYENFETIIEEELAK
jgi:protein-disulfide isomerase